MTSLFGVKATLDSSLKAEAASGSSLDNTRGLRDPDVFQHSATIYQVLNQEEVQGTGRVF